MSKQILGDDPFGEEKAPQPPVAEKGTGKKAGKKAEAKAAAETKAVEETPAGEKRATATETATATAAKARVPIAGEAKSEGEREYGPSIDRSGALSRHSGFVEEVKQLEQRVRERLLPSPQVSTGEHAGERNRLPLPFLWKRWRELAMRDRSEVVDEFGRDPNVAAKIEPLLEFLYRSYFRVDARGLGHIPDDGRALIVANHSGTLPYDGAMIMYAVKHEHAARRDVRPLVEDFVFHFPYLGTLMNRIGGVRACPENAERLLEQDQLVAVFPEGQKGVGKLFRERYQLQRFGRGGFIKLALKTDAPIIPTAVVGAEEIHPMLTKITWLTRSVGLPYIPITPTFPALGPLGLVPLPSKWLIAFGEPLYYNTEYGAEAANDRILVNKLAEQVRSKIQGMLDELRKTRRSFIFG